jgi:tRNA (guanine37-N1)-methyltransferase
VHISIVTLFPEMFAAIENYGISGRAIKQKIVELDFHNPRDFTRDRHSTVDGRPYGGGPGMVMMVEPLRAAIHAAKALDHRQSKTIYLSPQGRPLDQRGVEYLAGQPHLILVAGRYEGVDERLIRSEIDEEWSIGDYVLSGGELPAMVMIDAIVRLLPGVLGHELSAQEDSFVAGLLDCPHYTRPESSDGQDVPKVLLSGHHEAIRRWRLKQSLGRTLERRPDLLEKLELSPEQEKLLAEYLDEK